MTTEKLIKSKQRVSDFGEVFTPAHIVKDMCDLVPEVASCIGANSGTDTRKQHRMRRFYQGVER